MEFLTWVTGAGKTGIGVVLVAGAVWLLWKLGSRIIDKLPWPKKGNAAAAQPATGTTAKPVTATSSTETETTDVRRMLENPGAAPVPFKACSDMREKLRGELCDEIREVSSKQDAVLTEVQNLKLKIVENQGELKENQGELAQEWGKELRAAFEGHEDKYDHKRRG